jgi:predicted nucleic acid-binding protein
MQRVLVDSSVWIDHLKNTNDKLVRLIDDHQNNRAAVYIHHMVLSELLLGGIDNNVQTYAFLQAIPTLPIATFSEFEVFVKNNRSKLAGVGFVDVNLLISCILKNSKLYTLNKSLVKAAKGFGFAY